MALVLLDPDPVIALHFVNLTSLFSCYMCTCDHRLREHKSANWVFQSVPLHKIDARKCLTRNKQELVLLKGKLCRVTCGWWCPAIWDQLWHLITNGSHTPFSQPNILRQNIFFPSVKPNFVRAFHRASAYLYFDSTVTSDPPPQSGLRKFSLVVGLPAGILLAYWRFLCLGKR